LPRGPELNGPGRKDRCSHRSAPPTCNQSSANRKISPGRPAFYFSMPLRMTNGVLRPLFLTAVSNPKWNPRRPRPHGKRPRRRQGEAELEATMPGRALLRQHTFGPQPILTDR
jgi:hypothetical protein